MAPQDIDVEEGLDNYWKAIPDEERQEWIKEENFFRSKLHGQLLDDEQFLKLIRSKAGTKLIQNTISYDILKNTNYQQQFQYTRISLRNTHEEKVNSEKVTILMNLGFIPDEKIEEFRFAEDTTTLYGLVDTDKY